MIERGLALYSGGDLAGALIEWRRALDREPANRRARDYVSYVEDHYDVLDERIRAGRSSAGPEPSGPTIEMEAGDPMEDLDAYESIELEVPDATGEGTELGASPPETAPAVQPRRKGKSTGGWRSRGKPRLLTRELDEGWSLDVLDDLWPSERNGPADTIEVGPGSGMMDDLSDLGAGLEAAVMAALEDNADEVDDADDADDADEEPTGARPVSGAMAALDANQAPADAAAQDEVDREMDREVDRKVDRESDQGGEAPDPVGSADDPDAEGEAPDPGTGEITLPASRSRQWRQSRSRPPEAESTAPEQVVPREDIEPSGFDLSDFELGPPAEGTKPGGREPEKATRDMSRMLDPDPEASGAMRAERSDATQREEPDDEDEDRLALEEVRVTFRSPKPGDTEDLGRAETLPGRLIQPQIRGPGSKEIAAAEPDFEIDLELGPLSSSPPAHGSDEDDDESTLERQSGSWPERGSRTSRPPTEDPDIPVSSVIVDETLLTFEDETRERPSLREMTRDLDSFDGRPTVERPGGGPIDGGLPGMTPSARTTLGARERPFSVGSEVTREIEAERATTELHQRQVPRAREPIRRDPVSVDRISAELQAELEASLADSRATDEERVRARVGWLIDQARDQNTAGRFPVAVVAIDLALSEHPDSAVAQKLIHSNRELLLEVYKNYLGELKAVPILSLPMSAIPVRDLDHRAAFLLSRVDGVISLEDVLDVSGMARLEAFRHLCRLILRGILEIRA